MSNIRAQSSSSLRQKAPCPPPGLRCSPVHEAWGLRRPTPVLRPHQLGNPWSVASRSRTSHAAMCASAPAVWQAAQLVPASPAAARQQDVPPGRRERQCRGFAEAGRGPGNEHPRFGVVRLSSLCRPFVLVRLLAFVHLEAHPFAGQRAVEHRDALVRPEPHTFQSFLVGADHPGLKARPIELQPVANALVHAHDVPWVEAFAVGGFITTTPESVGGRRLKKSA